MRQINTIEDFAKAISMIIVATRKKTLTATNKGVKNFFRRQNADTDTLEYHVLDLSEVGLAESIKSIDSDSPADKQELKNLIIKAWPEIQKRALTKMSNFVNSPTQKHINYVDKNGNVSKTPTLYIRTRGAGTGSYDKLKRFTNILLGFETHEVSGTSLKKIKDWENNPILGGPKPGDVFNLGHTDDQDIGFSERGKYALIYSLSKKFKVSSELEFDLAATTYNYAASLFDSYERSVVVQSTRTLHKMVTSKSGRVTIQASTINNDESSDQQKRIAALRKGVAQYFFDTEGREILNPRKIDEDVRKKIEQEILKDLQEKGIRLLEISSSKPFADAREDYLLDVAEFGEKKAKAKAKKHSGKKTIRGKRSGKSTRKKEKRQVKTKKYPITPNPSAKKSEGFMGTHLTLGEVLATVNENLHGYIRENMGKGGAKEILNYRTGRFARSAEITSFQATAGRSYLADITYQRSPYDVFLPGHRLYKPGRDPKKLIGKSVRQILQDVTRKRLSVNFRLV